MAKADILALVSQFCIGQPVDAEVTTFCNEIIRELGFVELLVGVEEQAIEGLEPRHVTEPNTIRTLEFHTGSYGRLDVIDSQSLEACIWPQWRAGVSSPKAITYSHEDQPDFRLVPTPGSPDTLKIIRTEFRDDVPVWLELPIAFEVMSREFGRESDHQDLAFAEATAKVALLMFQLLGVEFSGATTVRPDSQSAGRS